MHPISFFDACDFSNWAQSVLCPFLSCTLTPCIGYHYCTTSLNKAWTQVLRRFKSCLWHVGGLWWWGSLTMVPAGSKAKCLSSINHTTKTIHLQFINSLISFFPDSRVTSRPLLPVSIASNAMSIFSTSVILLTLLLCSLAGTSQNPSPAKFC